MPRPRKLARLWLRPADAKGNAVWVILDGGRQIRTGCSAEQGQEAEAKLRNYLIDKRDPAAAGTRPPNATLIGDVLSIYLDDVVPKTARPTKGIARVERLIEFWGEKMLSEISDKTCEEYAATRKKGGARRDLEDLQAAINHHARRGLHTGVVAVTLPPKGAPRSRYLTREEVARLLWYCWRHKRPQTLARGAHKGEVVETYHDLRHLARFILMGVYTGSRSAPILRASIYAASGRAFIDLDSGLYHRLAEDMVEADNKKSPVCRPPKSLMAHIRRWRDRGHIAQFVVEWNGRPVKSIKTGWATAVEGAKLKGKVTPHTLRHTCVTWLKQKGVSSFEVGHYVGMSEQMVERVYGHHDPNFQGNAARALMGNRGASNR